MDYVLRVSNLSVSLKDRSHNKVLVSNISFDVKRGSILGIVGESGSGKTLTILAIMELLNPGIFKIQGNVSLLKDNNFVELLGMNSAELSRIRGEDMAMIFQEPLSSINPNKKCGTQLIEAVLTHRDIGPEKARVHIVKTLKEVGLDETDRIMKSYPHQLSGGQLQRVMIAMSICNDPAILMADEPTTSLDVTTQKEILELIKTLTQKWGMTTILISHDPAVMADIADEIVVMRNGKIIESGSLRKVLHAPEQEYTRSLLNISRIYEPQTSCRLDLETNNELPLLEVRNLSKCFQLKKQLFTRDSIFTYALKDVSVKIFKGQIHGIVGESGSGKSTLASCITGLQVPDDGEIYYQSQLLYDNGNFNLNRKLIQMIFQDPYSSLNPRMRVGNAIYEAFSGKHHNLRDEVVKLLVEVGLDESYYNRYPHQLSGGQRQRICIARALASKPSLLICDEAVSALDKHIQNKIISLLLHLKNTYSLTILFISHDLSIVQKCCDHITVLYKGRVEEDGPTMSVFKAPQSPYTKQLIASMPSIPGRD